MYQLPIGIGTVNPESEVTNMSRVKSKGGYSSIVIKSEPSNDNVHYTDKIKVEKRFYDEVETEVDLKYIKEDMKEEPLMKVKQEEITVKFDMPSSCDTQNDLTDYRVILTEDIQRSPISLNTETSISTEEKLFACSFFQHKTSTKRDLKGYTDLRHTRKKPSSNVKFQCAECEYKTLRKWDLVPHMVVHTKAKAFACNLCDFKTIHKSNLKKHMMKHTGEKPFSCNFCEYKSTHNSHLKRHLLTHTGEKPFACNLCELRTADKSKLRNHMMQHTGEKPFACNLCEFKTTQKSNLKSHIMKHKGEKPFACNICEFKTVEKRSLKYHMMTHTGEKPFACNLCEFKTTENSNLRRHMRKHTGEKPFACNICEFKSAYKHNLKAHIMKHKREQPFANNLCDFKQDITEDEALMEVIKEEIIIKDAIPSNSATQSN